MEGISIKLICWEDGKREVVDMTMTDRWTLHTAEEATVTLAGQTIRLIQEPKAINATRMGVGACLWEGELLLAAYLASLPLHRFIGARVIELGSGPGLVGLLLAKLGARVLITDIAKVLPLIEKNVEANGLSPAQRGGGAAAVGLPGGVAEVSELEWGKAGYEEVVASMAGSPVDWVLAADCCYIDNEGASPSTPHFVRTCHGLCTSPSTRCLVSFELRSDLVKAVFLSEARKAFRKVTRVPPSQLPKGCQVDHIELYDLAGKREDHQLSAG